MYFPVVFISGFSTLITEYLILNYGLRITSIDIVTIMYTMPLKQQRYRR